MLVGDIGGTNARFATINARGEVTTPLTLRTCDYPGVAAAIRGYFEQTGATTPKHVCLAIACAITGDDVHFTNNQWSFSRSQLATTLELQTLELVPDFTALALALPGLLEQSGSLLALKEGQRLDGYAMAVVGPGTGLGVASLQVGRQGRWIATQSEGGHASFAPRDEDEIAVMRWVDNQYGRTSCERLLSGMGIENIYLALHDARKLPCPHRLAAAEIAKRALDGSDALAHRALSIFCGALGGFAGDVALMMGAFGGIFIGGGIAPRVSDFLLASTFRQRFEDKGRASPLVQQIPIHLIVHPYPGLLGAAAHLQSLPIDHEQPT